MFSVRPILIIALVGACSPRPHDASSAEARRTAAVGDSSFADVQSRGHAAMGVDQYDSMAARRAKIRYVVESLPRGAALRLTTGDSSVIEAIHEFLAFQRRDHRAGAHHRE